MNKFEKYGTMLAALIGVGTGGCAVFNDYSESEFKKPMTLRVATVNSFKSQIESVKNRKDNAEILRLSIAYEKYEESWRNRFKLALITERITNLVSLELEPEQNEQIKQLLENTDTYTVEPAIIGSAYLATGDYKNATKYYKVAAVSDPTNPNIYALRSLALRGEAHTEGIEAVRVKLIQEARSLEEMAENRGADSKQIELLLTELKAEK